MSLSRLLGLALASARRTIRARSLTVSLNTWRQRAVAVSSTTMNRVNPAYLTFMDYFLFIFIRQALQLHANVHLKDRKLPKLRTFAEKYSDALPDMTRQDGLGWNYGRSVGAYGQLHCISMILQAMRDQWIAPEKMPLYLDSLRRLFQYFFVTYIDQEKGDLIIRDDQRNTVDNHTTRIANFDAARYLCQWARLARVIGGSLAVPPPNRSKTAGRFVIFDKSHKKEHGLFLFRDENIGVQYQLPLISPTPTITCDNLAFPHCPGIFDWPVNRYLPVMLPELTFGDNQIIPSYYGKNCVTGIGLKNPSIFALINLI